MPYGYNGKILRVNLTEHALSEETPAEVVYRRYMGGSALSLNYQAMGWDPQTGVPTEGRLSFLGLDWLIEKK
jgi:aldehyde:ferredoxin oxidoreductase